MCFKMKRPASRRQAGLARTGLAHQAKALIEKTPIDLLCQPHQRMAQVDDLFERWAQKVLLSIVPWPRHRAPRAVIPAPSESRSASKRNRKTQESDADRSLSCKFDYSTRFDYTRPAIRSAFFTGDQCLHPSLPESTSAPELALGSEAQSSSDGCAPCAASQMCVDGRPNNLREGSWSMRTALATLAVWTPPVGGFFYVCTRMSRSAALGSERFSGFDCH
jgi:hypothetical protein